MDYSQVKMKKKIISASFFVILGYGFSQLIRLVSNVILTRLLFPEYFGIIAIALVFQRGIFLLSDLGMGPSIIRSKRSNDQDFLNTAWTIQFLRSIGLCLLSIIIAYPVSVIYKVPILMKILPIFGLFSIVQGLNSTSLDLLEKNLNQRKKVSAEILFQLIGTSIMIIFAYYTRSIWALIIPYCLNAVLLTAWSHRINTFQNRLFLEKEAARELLSFGKWIMFSTAMSYLASQADRILLGRFLGVGLFGVYNIALMFSEFPKSVVEYISAKVVFPVISNIPYEQIKARIEKPRMMILYISAVALALFSVTAHSIILFLYDDRYSEAAWMLPILALGIWPRLLVMSIDRSLLTIGKPHWLAAGNIVKFAYMVTVLPIAYYFGNVFGAIIAVALNDIPLYVIINIGLKKEKQGLILQDMKSTILLVLILATILLIKHIMGMGFSII